MKVLGITGGIGAGKSRILNELKTNHGAHIVEADRLAHQLMEPGGTVYETVVAEFGREILSEVNPYPIDRTKLSALVFADEEKLKRLNQLTHPKVKESIKEQIEEAREEGDISLFVIEAALLIQDGYMEICDEIWYVYASREKRMERLMKQRGYTKEKCIQVFDCQESDEYYRKYANFTINNDFDYENSSKQLNARLNKFLTGDIIH